MTISVIVPCYNVENYIEQCIQSLLNQTLDKKKLQLIFVDDCSTDHTLEILVDYEARFPERIILIPLEENIRQGGARNIGISYATGDYIGFVDADDWVEPDMFEILHKKAMESNYDVIHCGGYRNLMNGDQAIFSDYESDRRIVQEVAAVDGGELQELGYGGVWLNIFRRNLLIDNEIYFPERVKFEDNYFMRKVSLYAKTTYICSGCKYHYRDNNFSTVRCRNDMSQFDRLKIELMIIELYKEKGLFERFYPVIQDDFLQMYFCNTVLLMASRFDEPPYEILCEMQKVVRKVFPNYKDSALMKQPDEESRPFDKVLLKLVDMELSKEEFHQVMNQLNKKRKV